LAAIGTALCDTGRRVDAWSRLLSAMALLACALPTPADGRAFVIAGIVLAGLGQLFYALRSGFDRAIFAHWASLPDDALPAALAAFDQGLVASGLGRTRPERPLAERVDGVRRLVSRQLLALALQIAGTAALAAFILAD
jgi:hypothetical protein